MIKALIVSLISTWILELSFAWFMNLRSKEDLKLVLLVNFITNPIVVSLYWIFYRSINPMILTFTLESSAILVEAFYYKEFTEKIRHPLIFSVMINLFSYLSGVLIQMF